MSEPVYSFGAWARLRRQALMLTREQLSQRVGCAEVTIRKIESDERRPSAQVAELLAHHLAVPTEQHELFVRVARGVETVERLPQAAGVTLVATATLSNMPAAVPRPTTNLPLAPNGLIGRDRDLAAIEGLLAGDARLVTLTGAGGSGKTRLALEVGRQIQERYPDGVWFVDLSTVNDAAQLIAAIAQALNVPEIPSRPLAEGILTWLRDRQVLLVLDNCEQAVDDVATLVAAGLRQVPMLQILATSRVPLCIAAEHEYAVAPLTLPPETERAPERLEQYAAVMFFVKRAQALRADFQLHASNASYVASICRRLDGLPLAMELAAARMRALTACQLLERLQSHGPLSVLSSGTRDLPARQQTMRATIDWSFRLLSAAQQRLLARSSVFAGSWSLEAAEAVCGDNIDVLTELEGLIQHSLVRVADAGYEPRYHMPESVREYADERLRELDERARVEAKHIEFYVNYVAHTSELLHSSAQAETLPQFDLEHPNLLLVRDCFLATEFPPDLNRGLVYLRQLVYYWAIRTRFMEWQSTVDALHRTVLAQLPGRGLQPLDQITIDSLSSAEAERCAQALTIAADLACALTQLERHRTLVENASALAQRAGNLRSMLPIINHRWDRDTYDAYLDDFLLVAQQTNDHVTLAWVSIRKAILANEQGDETQTRTLLNQGLTYARASGDRKLIALMSAWAGWLYSVRGDIEQCRRCAQDSIDAARQLDDKLAEAVALFIAIRASLLDGDYAAITRLNMQRLALEEQLHKPEGVANCHMFFGIVALQQADYSRAAQHFRISRHIYETEQNAADMLWCLLRDAERALEQGQYADAAMLTERAIAISDAPSFAQMHLQIVHVAQCATASAIEERFSIEERSSLVLTLGSCITDPDAVCHAITRLDAAGLPYGQQHEAFEIAQAHLVAAWIGWLTNNLPDACRHLHTGMELFRRIGARQRIARCCELIAHMQPSQNSTRLIGAADAIREQIGAPLWPAERITYDKQLATARAHLGDAAFDAAWQVGCLLTWEQATHEALAWLDSHLAEHEATS